MKLDDPKLIQLYEYKPFVQNFIAYKLSEKLKATNKELTSTTEYADMYFGLIDENFANPIVIEELYYSFLKDFINYYGAESIGSIYKKYKSLSSNKERLAEFEKIFGDLDKLSPGNPSVDFSFPDVSGKVYSLSDFKGKYLYIDVWASWCGPCKQEIPYLRALKEKFKSKNIQIIGISVDETKSDWESILKSENLTGIQLYAGGWDNDLCNFFKINGIPRFILIDKQGNIINSNAERPSGDIEKILNGLEGM
jgi:thiol-disulfide isomerase/thioredoxin